MGRRGFSQAFFASFLVAFAVACSSASYEAPVAKFAAATQTAETSLAALNDEIGRSYWDLQKTRIGRGELIMLPTRGDCDLRSSRCRLDIQDKSGEAKPFTERGPLSTALEVMASIHRYADGLAAVLAADTASAVEGNVNTALGNVEKLAKTLADAQGKSSSSVPDFSAPAAQIVNWLVGQYVESVKLSALRHATTQADATIQEAANLFQQMPYFASLGTRRELVRRYQAAIDDLGPTPKPDAIDRVSKTAHAYDLFLQSDPSEAFVAMGKAHRALAQNLSQKNVTFASMAAEIERFVGEVERIAKAVKELSELLKPKE